MLWNSAFHLLYKEHLQSELNTFSRFKLVLKCSITMSITSSILIARYIKYISVFFFILNHLKHC